MKTAHVLLWQDNGMWHGACLEINAHGEGRSVDACQRELSRSLKHVAHVANLEGSQLQEAPDSVGERYNRERWQRWFRGMAPADVRTVAGYEQIDWLVRDGGEHESHS